MREERAYQQRMLNSEKKIVFCNWERGMGKTYSIFLHMITHGGIYRVICNSRTKESNCSIYNDKLNEWMLNYGKESGFIDTIKTDRDSILITTTKAGYLRFKYKTLKIIFSRNGDNYSVMDDYVVYDDDMPSNSELLHLNNLRGLKQILIMNTLDSMEFITDKEETIDNNGDFIDRQISELLMEFANTEKSCNTVRTRNDILKQISELQNIKSKLNS